MSDLLNAAEFAAAMQAEGERHHRAMQDIVDREDPEARWARVHNPGNDPTLCPHRRQAHGPRGCTSCACAYTPAGRPA